MSGQKVTTDPESWQKPVHEGSGVVTSDSLAAESYRDPSGGFSDPPGPQPSSSTTTNTTDTSNATVVKPGDGDGGEESYDGPPKGGKDAGVGPTYNVKTSDSDNRGGSVGIEKGASAAASSTTTTTAAAGVSDGIPSTSGKSKGDGSDEVQATGKGTSSKTQVADGFDGSERETDIRDVDTENDPARRGVQKFAERNAEDAGDSGTVRDRGTVGDNTGEYDTLKDTEA